MLSKSGLDKEIILSKDAIKKDPEEALISMPNSILIGYYSDIKLSDLKLYLYNKAEEEMVVKSAYYQIIKYESGYIWEIHEGGSGKGLLKSVIPLLEIHKEVIIKTSRRNIKIKKKDNGLGIISYFLNESDESEPTKGVSFSDKMRPVKNTGYAMYILGKTVFIIGVLSLFLSYTFKYVILDKEKELESRIMKSASPISKIDDIKKINLTENYIEKLEYRDNQWKIYESSNNSGKEDSVSLEPKEKEKIK